MNNDFSHVDWFGQGPWLTTHPLNRTHASNIVHRMAHSTLFLSDQTQMKYVKFEIQDLALFSHLTLISVTFDAFSEKKSVNQNMIRKSMKYIFSWSLMMFSDSFSIILVFTAHWVIKNKEMAEFLVVFSII